MSNPLNHLYEFEGFRLDAKAGTLWRGDEVVSLSPKAAEVLKLLVVSQGRVVSKQEIFDSVWADTFVEDGVLTQNIYTLRHALGRDSEGRQFIETVPRRGYRFAGRLTVTPAGERAAVANLDSTAADVSRYYDETLSADYLDDDSIFASNGADESHSVKAARLAATYSGAPVWSSRPLFFGILAVVVLAAAGFAVYRFMPPRADTQQRSGVAPIEQIRFQSLTDTGDIIHPTISPDGEILAFVRVEGEQASAWVQQVAIGGALQILPPSRKGYRSLAFSSDGKYLFFRDEADPGSIYQTTRLGGTPKKVADNVWSDFSVSPDDKHFAFVRRDPQRNAHLLVLSNLKDGGERILGTRQLPNGYRGAAPAWSPDGKRLVVAIASSLQARPVLAEIEVDTGRDTELETPNFREITRVLWRPDGRQLIVAARLVSEATSQIWALNIRGGEVRRLTNDLEAYFWLSLSADGRTLVARQQRINAHLWLLPEGDLKRARQLTFGSRTLDGYVGLAWKPDGRIIFSSRSGETTDLYSLDPEMGERTQLTANAGTDNTWPTVSPDGQHIVFVSSRTGTRAVWRMDPDGRNAKQLTPGDERPDFAYAAATSPDGKEVFFIKAGGGPSAIWKTSIEGENEEPVSSLIHATAESFISVSPDGKWLAYQHVSDEQKNRSEDGSVRIGIIAPDGSAEPMYFDAPLRRPVVQWTSAESFDYAAGTFNASSLWRQELSGKATKLLDFPDRIFNFAWSRDGRNLVVSRGRLQGDAILITNLP